MRLLQGTCQGLPVHQQYFPHSRKICDWTVTPQKKISCGFGAGISKTGNICGAVSRAILVIGLKYGKIHAGDAGATEKTRALVRNLSVNSPHGMARSTARKSLAIT
jgi:hypothetical protein